MGVLFFLTMIFIVLTVLIFQKQAIYILTGTFLNIGIFLAVVLLFMMGAPIYLVTLGAFLVITLITLFFINSYNVKTQSAFISICLFLSIYFVISFFILQQLQVAGFAKEELEELAMYDFHISLPFFELTVAYVLLSLSGAVIDGSMAIASATYEIFEKDQAICFKELVQVSLKVSKKLLSSTVNTLLFAFLSSNLALVIWFQDMNYAFGELINSKAFVTELAVSILTVMAGMLILPLTSWLTSWYFIRQQKKNAN